MLKIKLVLSLCVLVSSFSLFSKESCRRLVPNNSQWAFADAILDAPFTDAEKKRAFRTACEELDTTKYAGKFSRNFSQVANAFHSVVFIPYKLLNLGFPSFSSMDKSAVQRAYKREVELIKAYDDPYVRIKKAYELAVSYQGAYDYDENGKPAGGGYVFPPSKLIDEASRKESAGVCRDFASLLYWTLMKVNMSNSARENYNGMLRPGSFTPGYESGFSWTDGITPSGHAWIRVTIAKDVNGSTRFESFDLDTTWYENFSPIPVRHVKRSDRDLNAMLSRCEQIRNCL